MESQNALADDFSERDIIRMSLTHISEARDAFANLPISDAQPTRSDIAELARSILVANLVQSVTVNLYTRDAPQTALGTADRYQWIFDGHPMTWLLRAAALAEMGNEHLNGVEKDHALVGSADAVHGRIRVHGSHGDELP